MEKNYIYISYREHDRDGAGKNIVYIVLRTIVIKSSISDQLILIRLVENLVEITQIKNT